MVSFFWFVFYVHGNWHYPCQPCFGCFMLTERLTRGKMKSERSKKTDKMYKEPLLKEWRSLWSREGIRELKNECLCLQQSRVHTGYHREKTVPIHKKFTVLCAHAHWCIREPQRWKWLVLYEETQLVWLIPKKRKSRESWSRQRPSVSSTEQNSWLVLKMEVCGTGKGERL